MDEESIYDLRTKLAEYHQQLGDVNGLLEADPRNEEYIQIKKDLVDVISLTEDLVKLKEAEEETLPPPAYNPSTSSTLPANFFSVGTICEAKYSEDGVWYKAKINTILEGGKYHVTYTEYGNEEVVAITDIRPLTDTSKKSSSSVTPLKRPAVPDTFQAIPKSLQVLPTDTDEERLRKRKKVKAIKSGNRLKTIEDEGKSKKSAWQSFQTKTQKAVPLSYTGKKKESIFKSPDVGGRIGVTGSGKPMTQDSSREQFKLAAKKGDIYMPSNDV